MRAICYPTQLQEQSVRNWLKSEITAILSEGTQDKMFTLETSDLELPFDLIQANVRVKTKVSLNDNYKNPQREVMASISIQPIIGIDEGQESVIFMDLSELESIRNY